MDNVSSLADKSNDFSNLLTVSRKFGLICLYIFRIIYPSKSIWQMILPHTDILHIFRSSIQLGNILKLLTNNCDRETINYIPARDLWINSLYFSISNESKNSCLTTDYRKSGPIGQMQTVTLNNFVIMVKIRRIDFSINFQLKELIKTKILQFFKVYRLTKNGETKIYKAVQESKSLVKQNDGKDRSSDKQQITEQSKFVDRKYLDGRTKNGRRPRFLSQ